MKFVLGILRFLRSLMLAVLVVLPVGMAITIYMNRDYLNPAGFRMWREYLFPTAEPEAAPPADWGHETIPDPDPDIVEIARLLRAGDHDGLEALHARNPVAFNYFRDTSPDLADPLDAWVAARPDSALPRIVRGHHWFHVGWQRRGVASADGTSDVQFDEMREAFGRAERDYLVALGLDPSAEVAYRRLLSIYKATSQGEEMLAVWQAALDAGAGTWRLHEALFDGLKPWWSGLETQRAVELVRQILGEIESGAVQSTGDPALLRAYPEHIEAARLARAGRPRAALAKYEPFIDGPSGALYLHRYANHLYHAGRHAESLAYYAAALRREPSSAGIWGYYAWALIRAGRSAEAAEALDHALSLDPYDPASLRRRAVLHAEAGRHRQALADYDAAKVYGSERAWVWSGAGGMRLKLREELPRAAADYRRAIELDPDRASDYFSLGLAFDHDRDCRAVPAYRSYLAVCRRLGDCLASPLDWVEVRWKQLLNQDLCSIDGYRLNPDTAWVPIGKE